MRIIATLIALFATCIASVYADNIFSDLKTPKEGQGEVVVSQPAAVGRLLDKKKEAWSNKKQLTFSGYRVQVYMGNHQKQSKDEASQREASIKSRYPELTTYLTFSSPFWRLRVGDFRTHADALILANKLKSEFFKWEGDIYIVRDNEVFNTDFEKNDH